MKDAKPMSLARLAELLDAYGAEPERWPAHEREPALALIASDPKAAEAQGQALLLDRQLDGFDVPDASAQLRARVLEIPIRRAVPERRRMWLPGWAIAACALVPCALGFISGSMTSEPDDGWNDVAQLAQLGDISEDEWP